MGSGPLLRLNLGTPVADRLDAELWVSGIVDRAPLGSFVGDRLVLGGGASGRLLVSHFGEERRFGFWLHGGAGLGVSTGGEGTPGPMGFAGALVSWQPTVQRFMIGLEADGVAWENALGVAVLPSLRCTF
jgi:hypothetical protein